MKKIIIALVVVGVIAAAAWTGFKVMKPNSPLLMLAQMQEEMMDVESFKFDGVLSVEGTVKSDSLPTSNFLGSLAENGEKETQNISGSVQVDFDGAMNKNSENMYELSTDFGINYMSQKGGGGASVSLLSFTDASYVKLISATVSDQTENKAVIENILGLTQNNWVKFQHNKPQDEEEAGSVTNQAQLRQDFKDLMENLGEVADVTTIGIEDVRGVEASKMSFEIDTQEAFEVIVQDAQKRNGVAMTDEEKQELRVNLEKIADLNMFVWVGKKDNLLHKFELSGPISDEARGYVGTLAFAFELFDHNVSNTIVAPQDAVGFEEMMGSVIGGMMGGLDLNALTVPEGEATLTTQMPAFDPNNIDVEALQELYATQGITIPQQ